MSSQSTIGGVTAYPLAWPANRKRTPRHMQQSARFKVSSFASARDNLLAEVARLRGRSVVLSTNIGLRNDGLPYANQRQPDDTGVAIYFIDKKGGRKCFACDRWRKIEDNMHAIEMTIAALRGIERWGSGEDMEAAFSGFAALPPSRRPWWEVLGLSQSASLEDAKIARQILAQRHHPDRNGEPGRMSEINAAFDDAVNAHA